MKRSSLHTALPPGTLPPGPNYRWNTRASDSAGSGRLLTLLCFRTPPTLRETAEGGSPTSPDIARLVREFFTSLAPADQECGKLSTREQEVLDLLIRGFVKKEIADQLSISEETVRTHCQHIYKKLHVNCREHAVAKTVPMAALEWMKPSVPIKTRDFKRPSK